MWSMRAFWRKLFTDPAPDRSHPSDVAVAALLVEAARADGDYVDAERALIDRALAGLFDLGPWEAAALRARGEAAQGAAADLWRFTRAVKTGLPQAERLAVLEALWAVALSDGARDPHEDALIRQLAPLLALTDRDSAEARRRVAGRDGADG
jgi:uncharacterized tellurite resistance protein B-like protein